MDCYEAQMNARYEEYLSEHSEDFEEINLEEIPE
jgi:hypothetical protein